MFRELNRKSKEISTRECHEILTRETRGVLSVNGDNGYPYGMPINFYFDAEQGCIYFHSGKRESHRMDAIRRCDKVSFCVVEPGTRAEGEWALTARSVIIFGRVSIIEDLETVASVGRALSYKFTHDEAFIEREIARFAKGTTLFKLTPEHICGKRVREE